MTWLRSKLSELASSVAQEQPAHDGDQRQVEPDPCRLGDCVEGAEAVQVEGVVQRMRHCEYGERADRDRTQQPPAGYGGRRERDRQSKIERADVTNEVFVVRRKQCDPGVSKRREAGVKARWS